MNPENIVPVVDISPFDTDPEAARQVARQVANACAEVGFLYIAGHGVPRERTAQVWRIYREFFDLPVKEKMALEARSGLPFGYHPFEASALAYSVDQPTPPDLREVFISGPPFPPDDPWYRTPEAAWHFAEHRWPSRPADMSAVLARYHELMANLAAKMMRVFAVALDLPQHFFDPITTRSSGWLQCNNYPELPATVKPGQLRASAHSDYTAVTLLIPDDTVGGLEVLGDDQLWHPVTPIPQTIVVNLGDLMARWTNDRWRSTVHRVANPPAEMAGRTRRQSVAFFAGPNYDETIDCIPTCLAPGETPKYPPITAGAHLAEKWTRAFGEAATTGTF